MSTVRIDIRVDDAEAGDEASACAWEAGALGIEEVTAQGGLCLRVYAPPARADAIAAACVADVGDRARVAAPQAVPEQDWSEAWREGLDAVVASRRLVVRPSFVEREAEPGQKVLVVDPGQAFGTGHHASTRLAMRLMDEALDAMGARVGEARMLDVGTGSGVLALGAVALGAHAAVGFDLDPLAAPEARANAEVNGLASAVHFFTGPLDAIETRGFDVIVANMIPSEVMPLLEGLEERVARDGCLVLSGLLKSDLPRIEPALSELGLAVEAQAAEVDGGDEWIGIQARRVSA
jgi:ribosomal protein L11 methyltransferase